MNRRIKVAVVVSNLEYGGAQQQIVELVNRIDHDRFDMHLVSLSDFVPLADNLDSEAVSFEVIQKRNRFDVTVPLRLARYLRKHDIDLVHGFLFDAEIAARLAACVGDTIVVGSERNCDYVLKPIKKRFYDLTRRLQDFSVANSFAGRDFNATLLGYPESHYRVVHNGVNIERFHPGEVAGLRAELGIAPDARVVGMFGSFKYQKNHAMLFRVAGALCAEYPDLVFLLVGDELHGGMHGSREYKEELEATIDKMEIRDRLVFVGNRDDVERYYRICDVKVLPSRFEGMPNVLLEAMATGLPVVATKVADNSLLVPDGEVGFLVDVDDDVAMQEGLHKLLKDAALRNRMGQAAVTWVRQNFASDVMAKNMGEVYEELVSLSSAA